MLPGGAEAIWGDWMRTPLACLLCLASSPAWADCDTSDALMARLQLQIDQSHKKSGAYLGHPPSDADVTEIFKRYDQQVSASIAHCRGAANQTPVAPHHFTFESTVQSGGIILVGRVPCGGVGAVGK